MKIVHFCQYFSSKLGYQEFNLAKSHAKAGHDVTVITSDRYFPFPNYLSSYEPILGKRIQDKINPKEDKEFGYKIIRLKPLIESPNSATLLLSNPLRYLNEIKPDLIICHEFINPSTYWCAKYKATNPTVKLIIDNHAAHYNSNFDTLAKKIYLVLWRHVIGKQLLKYADSIVATGPSEKEFIEKYYFPKTNIAVKIIPLGGDIERFRPQADVRKIIRKNLNLTPKDVLIINAGKINPDKCNLELLRSFIQVHRKYPNLRLMFVGNGDGKYIDTMKQIIKQNNLNNKVFFLGMVSNEKLSEYLAAADIGVWPGSKSNVFLEAMASGLPLILKSSSMNTLTSYNNGWTVRTFNDITKKLEYLIKKPGKLKEYGKNSLKAARKIYNWDVIANQFINET